MIQVTALATDERELLQRRFDLRPDIPLVMLGSNGDWLAFAGTIVGTGTTAAAVPSGRNHFRDWIGRLLDQGPLQLDTQQRYATRLERVQACVERGHLAAAAAPLSDAIALNPERPESYNWLGVIHQRYGEFDLARKCFHIALVLDPTFEPAAQNLERLCILPHPPHPAQGR